MKSFLQESFRRVAQRVVRRQRAVELISCWLAAAALGVGFLLLQKSTGWSSLLIFPLLAGVAVSAAFWIYVRHGNKPAAARELATKVESAYPELRGLALTAATLLEPRSPEESAKSQGYLPEKVLSEAVAHAQATRRWDRVASTRSLRWISLAQVASLLLFFAVLWEGKIHARRAGGWLDFRSAEDVVVLPGDTEIERGDALVVTARFGRTLPPNVEIITSDDAGKKRQLPLVKSLADPIFGVSVPEVSSDFHYHLEYSGGKTATYTVKVFEHPRVERADFELKFPTYTKLPVKRIEDTRRISAVEGSQVAMALQLNKPVASAMLVAHDAAKTKIALEVAPGKASAQLLQVPFLATQTYDVVLVDADHRTNRSEAPFVLEVLPNQRPEIHLTSPRGDVRPSPLEEISFAGTVSDDFGVIAYGIGYTVGGGAPHFISLGANVKAREKTVFSSVLRLEDLKVKPDDLLSWFAWADDLGPDGQLRRSSTDLFFGEVRPFEEIFRESQQTASDDDDNAGGGTFNQAKKLTELEKQIMTATWKLQSNPSGANFSQNLGVIHDSQVQAIAQAESSAAEARNPRTQSLWGTVTEKMKLAASTLTGNDAQKLPDALAAEQSSYQSLLALQAHETEVSRKRNRGGNGGGGNQKQIDQLDMAISENRYETQRQAKSPESAERREQNQVLSRLQELARRQQDVNDRLKEMQTALQAARTDTEREEVRRQLKRLEEEQRQMLADMDDVRQRMQRPELQSSADQQAALDQTRQDLQKSAEASNQGSVAQALSSGTRAQRQLQQLRDDVRKQNSSAFSEDLQQMRAEARELQNSVDQLANNMTQPGESARKSLAGGPDHSAEQQKVEEQQKKLSDLVDRASKISEQAENSEPLLAKQLYDSVRQLTQQDTKTVKDFREQLVAQGMLSSSLNDKLTQMTQDDSKAKTLSLASDLLRSDEKPAAGEALRRAAGTTREFQRGVEKAAEGVLGDDVASLKMAQSELGAVTQQLDKELRAQGQKNTSTTAANENKNGTARDARPGQPGDAESAAAPGENNPGDKGSAKSLANSAQKPGESSSGTAEGNSDNENATAAAGGLAENTGNARNRRGISDLDHLGRAAWDAPDDALAGLDGPLLGNDFAGWSDRLRDVEQLVDQPAWRDAVANARERARHLRQNYTREKVKPDWAVVRAQVMAPLIEVQSRITEELARRDNPESLVPIDRDPVPGRYAESVRRYYEELGKN